jgi:hypothetical protein
MSNRGRDKFTYLRPFAHRHLEQWAELEISRAPEFIRAMRAPWNREPFQVKNRSGLRLSIWEPRTYIWDWWAAKGYSAMRTCLLCGSKQGVRPLILPAAALVDIESEYPDFDVDIRMSNAGTCVMCLTLPVATRNRIIRQRIDGLMKVVIPVRTG